MTPQTSATYTAWALRNTSTGKFSKSWKGKKVLMWCDRGNAAIWARKGVEEPVKVRVTVEVV